MLGYVVRHLVGDDRAVNARRAVMHATKNARGNDFLDEILRAREVMPVRRKAGNRRAREREVVLRIPRCNE